MINLLKADLSNIIFYLNSVQLKSYGLFPHKQVFYEYCLNLRFISVN